VIILRQPGDGTVRRGQKLAGYWPLERRDRHTALVVLLDRCRGPEIGTIRRRPAEQGGGRRHGFLLQPVRNPERRQVRAPIATIAPFGWVVDAAINFHPLAGQGWSINN